MPHIIAADAVAPRTRAEGHAEVRAARAHEWRTPAALVLLGVVPALAGITRVTQIATGAAVTAENARFLATPLPVLIHIPAAIVFSILGAFQFPSTFRHRHRAWHRGAGYVLVPAALLVALSGLWMTQCYPWPAGDGVALYIERLVAGSAMLASTLIAIDALRRRQFNAHGAWMMRAYALGLGAGTQVLTHVPWFILERGRPGEFPRAVMMGAGWVINVAVAEWIIRRRVRKPLGSETTF